MSKNTIEKAVLRLKKAKLTKSAHSGFHVNGGEISDSALVGSSVDINIDYSAFDEAGFLTPGSDNEILLEEYRLIKRPLLKNAFGKGVVPINHGNVIMVCSALPGEGKTFTSLNLAISMAMEKDTTVLLVDADVTKPALSKLIGIEGKIGLTDVMTNDILHLSDIFIRTNINKLSVIPAGTKCNNATEMLASKRMADIVEELSDRYSDRVIIFDLPPVMVTTHAEVLLENAGQILLVVEEGKTPVHVVQETVSKFNDELAIGIVLNKCIASQKREYYGTYGSYGNN